MARSPFSIYTRQGTKGQTLFCVRFYDDSGKTVKSVTLKDVKSKSMAGREAARLLADGVVSDDKNPPALEYMKAFWTPDSDYVRLRALRGVVLSEQYMRTNGWLIAKHLGGPLKGKRLLDLTPALVDHIILHMAKAGAKARTINTTMQALRSPYAFFCRQHRLVNQLSVIEKLRETPKERGTLCAAELAAIIAVQDESPRVMAAVLLGGLCGLRLGEVRGLQWSDVDIKGGRIEVQHNFISPTEGLKAPKWGSKRTVPMPAPVLDALELCARASPTGKKAGYVLWNDHGGPGLPAAPRTIPQGYKRLLEKIGIPEAEQLRRNLVFHGLRHTFVSLSRATGMADFVVMRLAGHKSESMMERYSHVEKVIDFAQARASIESAMKAAGGAS